MNAMEEMKSVITEVENAHEEAQEALTETKIDETLPNDDESSSSVEGVDLSRFASVKSKSNTVRSLGSGVLSVINTAKNGKRLKFAEGLHEKLGAPDTFQIKFSDHEIAVGEVLPDKNNDFSLRNDGKSKVIYSSSLVDEITEKFDLDFSDRTSITFQEVEYVMIDGHKVAIVTID